MALKKIHSAPVPVHLVDGRRAVVAAAAVVAVVVVEQSFAARRRFDHVAELEDGLRHPHSRFARPS